MSFVNQQQIRENVLEAQDFVHDLHSWCKSVKLKDQELLSIDRKSSNDERKETRKSDEMTDVLVKMSDSEKAEELRISGNAAYRDGDFETAVALYSQSIEAYRTSISFANRAMVLLKIKKFAQAEDDCTEALKLDQSYLKVYQRRSVARKGLENIHGALEDAEMALRLMPSSAIVISNFQELCAAVIDQEGLNTHAPWKRQIQNIQTIPVKKEKKEIKVDGHVMVTALKQKLKIPPAPKTWAEFEAAYKLLKNDISLFSQYLYQLPSNSLSAIFKSSLTPPILQMILEAAFTRLVQHKEEGEHWVTFLENLSKVPRYDLLMMCFAKSQKDSLKKCFKGHHNANTLISKIEKLTKL